jgi:hypothetical protein
VVDPRDCHDTTEVIMPWLQPLSEESGLTALIHPLMDIPLAHNPGAAAKWN